MDFRGCGCLVAKSCLALCSTIDYSLPGSSVHGIFQARILEWVLPSPTHSLLQEIFPTQGSNPGLLLCRLDSFPREPPVVKKYCLCFAFLVFQGEILKCPRLWKQCLSSQIFVEVSSLRSSRTDGKSEFQVDQIESTHKEKKGWGLVSLILRQPPKQAVPGMGPSLAFGPVDMYMFQWSWLEDITC